MQRNLLEKNFPSTNVLSVSQLTAAIKAKIEPHFREVFVQGEISNFKQQSSGHLYFSLKDSNAQIAAALFKGNTFSLSRMPKDGDQVMVKGEISIYAPRGNYQIIVRELSFLGIGELLLKLHALKETLKAKGWFDLEHKKKLPKLPKKIGIVTSPTGAVIQDIINVLSRRFSGGIHIILNPVKVQGEGAAEEIAKAIYDFNQHSMVDLLIVGRGGGSLEDLWAFNEEIVAKAIFESKIPIISAVGHETDHSIADLVADVRAPTPSAAAEIAISEKAQLVKGLETIQKQCTQTLFSAIVQRKSLIAAFLKNPLLASPHAILEKSMQQLDELKNALETNFNFFWKTKRTLLTALQKQLVALKPSNQIILQKRRLYDFQSKLQTIFLAQHTIRKKLFNGPLLQKELENLLKKELSARKERLTKLIAHLKSLDPAELLKKGYSILFSEKDKSIILSIKELSVNQKFYALLSDGKVRAKVEETNL